MYRALIFSLGFLVFSANASTWNYLSNGSNWEGECNTGKRQSPININKPFYSSPTSLQFNYYSVIDNPVVSKKGAQLTDELNTGHSIQVNGDAGYFQYGNHRFEVTQFHFHHPSEHTLNGKHFPLEMHIVHKDQHDNLAVVAVFFEESDRDNRFLKQLGWGQFPKQGEMKQIKKPEGLDYFNDKETSYLMYDGSLTTPPCTEGVQWFIIYQHFPISKQQIDAWPTFKDAPKGTYRNAQPLNGRVLRSF